MKHQLRSFFIKSIIRLIAIGICLCVAVYLLVYLLGPPPLTTEQNTVYYSEDGTVIGKEQGEENRQWVDLDNVSEDLIHATLMIEDRDFFDHFGFDFSRIAGSILTNLATMSLEEGASTLTQQLARNLYLTHEKTWTRKLKEAFYTLRLEMHYSKEEILEGYLNTVYYGHGAYGIEAASEYFFDKSASDLTLSESSMLAGIPKGPTYYSPLNDEENANNRQAIILSIMQDHDLITEQEHYTAQNRELTYHETGEQEEAEIGPYFQDVVLTEAGELLQLDQEEVRSGGYDIHTTLDNELQKELEDQVEATVDASSEIQTGAIAMNPDTGSIVALVGGTNYEESPFNRATDAKRMPASSFKPFLYYAALENGYTATTMLESKPTTFELENGEVYQPSNYNGYYADKPITLAQALALSDNIYAVKTNMFLGAEKLVSAAKDFGITSDLPAVPSLALGSATVTLEEMVTGYSRIANGGLETNAHTIKKIVDKNGRTIYEREDEPTEQVLDENSTFILTQLMTGMFDRELDGYMSVTGSSIADELTRVYAGKSGTTQSDSWMIGYSPSLVTGVWTGYDDNRQIEAVAETAYAKDIWAGFMESAHEGTPQESFEAPEDVVGVPIDPVTGERATPSCDVSRIMYFEKGTEPSGYCSDHHHEEEEQTEDEEEEKGMVEQWFDLFSG